MGVKIGQRAELVNVVGIEDTAEALVSGTVDMLSTPRVVANSRSVEGHLNVDEFKRVTDWPMRITPFGVRMLMMLLVLRRPNLRWPLP